MYFYDKNIKKKLALQTLVKVINQSKNKRRIYRYYILLIFSFFYLCKENIYPNQINIWTIIILKIKYIISREA
jgi:hypothetical protein